MANFCSVNFAVCKAFASLKQCIEVILHIELKQSYCEIWEWVATVLAKLSLNFLLSLGYCSSLAGNQQYITGLSIYYQDIPCFDGLYLKKLHSTCSILRLGQNYVKILIFHLGQTEHCSVLGDGQLCFPHITLISFIWCSGCSTIALENGHWDPG